MKKKILAFSGVFVAFLLALVVPMSAAEIVGIVPIQEFDVSGFPGGVFTKARDFKLPGGDNPEYSTPPTFGLQLVTNTSSIIPVSVPYDTECEFDGDDIIFRYIFSAGDLLGYSNLYLRLFVEEDWIEMQSRSYSLKMNGGNKSVTLGNESDMHSLMLDQSQIGTDYWKFYVVTPSGQSVLTARQFRPLAADEYSMLTSSVFHPSAAMMYFTFELRIGDAIEDHSIDEVQVEDAGSLFYSLNDLSFAPASSVLNRFWNVPYIRYSMVGLGILALYAFIVRLF